MSVPSYSTQPFLGRGQDEKGKNKETWGELHFSKANPTFRLQSTLTWFSSSDTISFLQTSSVYGHKKPNAKALFKIQTLRGPTSRAFRGPEGHGLLRPPRRPPGRRTRHSPAANQRRAGHLLPGPAAPPAAGNWTSIARWRTPLSAQAQQLGWRGRSSGADAAGEDGAGKCSPHREGAAPRLS